MCAPCQCKYGRYNNNQMWGYSSPSLFGMPSIIPHLYCLLCLSFYLISETVQLLWAKLGLEGFCPHVGATCLPSAFSHNSKPQIVFSQLHHCVHVAVASVHNLFSTSLSFSAWYYSPTSIIRINFNKISSWLINLTLIIPQLNSR